MNNINDTYLARRFEQNINDITDIRKCGYCQMPFIPYTFSLYQSAPIKAFFIGRDTYYWCEYDESYANNPRAYMKENSEYVTVNQFKKDWSISGGFWSMVGKLQLQLYTGKYYNTIEELTEEEWKILDSVGYGNLFPLELPSTLKKKIYDDGHTGIKRNEYEDIVDKVSYRTLQRRFQSFCNLKAIFEAYGEPDVVFILSWSGSEKIFFEGLDYESKDEWYEHGLRAVYLSKTHKTKVIWTSHPRRFSFLKTNPQEMCQYLSDTYNALAGLH